MANSMKVYLKNRSGSGSNGFLRDAPKRNSLGAEDPALRFNLYQSITAQLQGYRGLKTRQGTCSSNYREERQSSYEKILEDWGVVMELCRQQKLYI